ncbi:MAG TPA: hypothetical protein VHK66_08220 [Microvirga sp.]|nr:hypothetical protein [Microvirga sp.]
MEALKAGIAYFAVVFAAGFLLGTVRVLLLAPRIGELGAVAVEVPLMLAVAWFACARLLCRFEVGGSVIGRFLMGGVAFGLLTIAEIGVSIAAFGRSPAEHLAAYRSGGSILGGLAQIAFAAIPLVQLWWPGKAGDGEDPGPSRNKAMRR